MVERKTLFIVCDDNDVYEQLKTLVELNDDTDEIIGVPDGSVRLFLQGESVWIKNKDRKAEKYLLIGNVKESKEIEKNLSLKFSQFGVEYGWVDNHAMIRVDERALSNVASYKAFLEEIGKLPIKEELKSDFKERMTIKKGANVFLVPFGFIKELKSSAFDSPKMIRRQMYLFGIVKFYYNHLAEFMAEATESDPVEADVATNNKLEIELKNTIDEYNAFYSILKGTGEELYTDRVRACDLIQNIENLVNSIANHPKSFDLEISEIETARRSFEDECTFAKEELNSARKSAISAGAGVAGGTAIACVAPTAAMWVATTFGTASTGTAISTLSGAAATKAALAWLGGGALAAGGGGTAAGEALLAMAGPIGWGAAAVSLLTSVVLFERKKMKLNKERKEEIEFIKQNTLVAKEITVKIDKLVGENHSLFSELKDQYTNTLPLFSKDYLSFDNEQKNLLGALVNNTKSLSKSLTKTIND